MNVTTVNSEDQIESEKRPAMPKRQDLLTAVEGLKGAVVFDAPLRELTSLRIGGPADVLVVPEDVADLTQLVRQAHAVQIPVFVLGGTNVLIRDRGIRGVVVSLGKLVAVESCAQDVLYAEAGIRMPRLLQEAISQSLSGLEWAAGIPGTLGGAVAMNAGTRLGEMKDCLQAVQLLRPDGMLSRVEAVSIEFSYRRAGLPEAIVVGAWLQLTRGVTAKIEADMKSYLQYRKNTQPLTQPNAGSVFKNPPNMSAGKLIEEAGLKGFRVGDVKVSPKHANFIVNMGQARATDAILLIKKIQQEVYHRTNIMLEPEWKIVGEP